MCSCPFRTFSSPLAAPDAASELDFQTDIRRQPSSCLTRFKIGFAPAASPAPAPPAPPPPTFSRRFQIGFSDKNLSFPFPSAAQMGFDSSLTRSPKENFNRQDSTHAHSINWINLDLILLEIQHFFTQFLESKTGVIMLSTKIQFNV